MADIIKRYMTVSIDLTPEGINLAAWMSTEVFWIAEKSTFQHVYTHMGDNCTWFIHSSSELTNKAISLLVETADRICHEGRVINERRKISNR